jgi:DnaJ-class molecular chaperone
MKNLYDILELDKNANDKEIKKQYKKLAMIHHPDRGGDSSNFKEISDAYDILSDKEKKESYDKYGSEKKMDINDDIFGSMFGMGGGMPINIHDLSEMGGIGSMFGSKNKKKIINVEITLDDIYTGTQKNVLVDVSTKCRKCKGNGYLNDGKVICKTCNGNRMVTISQEIAPRIIQQVQVPCKDCNQLGYTIKEDCICDKCDSTGLKKKREEYNLNIKKGSYDGKEIILEKKGDYNKDFDIRGDLIIKIKVIPHEKFIFKDNNLFLEEDISLGKALCGGYLNIDYLNNEKLIVDIDKIIKPNYLMKINGKGIPKLNDDNLINGDLIIKFNIEFPDNINNNKIKLLKNILDVKDENIDKDSEINNLEYYENNEENYNENINEEHYQENIQCAQQ